MGIEPLLEIYKIIARRPSRKLILSNIGFKDSLYLNKQRKNTASMIREAKVMAIVRPNGAGNSDERETLHKKYPCFQGFKALLVMNRFRDTRKCAKDQMKKTTSAAAPNPEWRCGGVNIMYILYLADTIEHFVIGVAILLAWWLLCRITLFVYMFFSNTNVRE